MKHEKRKREAKTSTMPEKISAEQALTRMKNFSKRKEKMIAFIIESKN